MFEEEGSLLLEQMAAALRALDTEALRRSAHAMRGACLNFGARPLEALCHEVETCARSGNLAAASRLLERVREEYRRVEAALRLECQTNPSV